jgi:hypothetical protein
MLISEQVWKRVQGVVSEAMEERRGLVVYSRLKAVEMDRMARRVERDALDKIGALLSEDTDDQRVLGLRNRLRRMREELGDLGERPGIRAQSRQMQVDEIMWQAFEDIAWMLGIH